MTPKNQLPKTASPKRKAAAAAAAAALLTGLSWIVGWHPPPIVIPPTATPVPIAPATATATATATAIPVPPGVRTGAYYFSGWWADPNNHWHRGGARGPDWRPAYPEREPLVGWLNDTQASRDAEIAEAADAGLAFWLFDWYRDVENPAYPGARAHTNDGLRYYLTSPAKARLAFGIVYANGPAEGNLYTITDVAEWRTTTADWAGLMREPSYLRVGGRPVLYILNSYNFSQQWPGQVAARLADLRSAAVDAGVGDPLIVGGQYSPNAGRIAADVTAGYDALGEYNLPLWALPPGANPYSLVLTMGPATWTWYRTHSAVPYLPTLPQGRDNRAWAVNPDAWLTDASPALFGQALALARAAADPRLPLVTLYAWNELGEGGELASHRGDGGAYLQQIGGAPAHAR